MAWYNEINETLEMDHDEDVPDYIAVYDSRGEFVANYVPEAEVYATDVPDVSESEMSRVVEDARKCLANLETQVRQLRTSSWATDEMVQRAESSWGVEAMRVILEAIVATGGDS